MAEHTPGPWTYDFRAEDTFSGGDVSSASALIAIVMGADHGEWRDADDNGLAEFEANAALIAAAPETAAECVSLKAANEHWHTRVSQLKADTEVLAAECDRLRDALESLVDDDPCRYDHSGFCQTHTNELDDGLCAMKVAREGPRRHKRSRGRPMMDLDQFITELGALDVAWPSQWALRCERNDCPITAVARAHGHDYSPHKFSRAAACIGLRADIAREIVAAADAAPHRNRFNGELRGRLLRACRVTAPMTIRYTPFKQGDGSWVLQKHIGTRYIGCVPAKLVDCPRV